MHEQLSHSFDKHEDEPLASRYMEGYEDENSHLCLRGSRRGQKAQSWEQVGAEKELVS